MFIFVCYTQNKDPRCLNLPLHVNNAIHEYDKALYGLRILAHSYIQCKLMNYEHDKYQ